MYCRHGRWTCKTSPHPNQSNLIKAGQTPDKHSEAFDAATTLPKHWLNKSRPLRVGGTSKSVDWALDPDTKWCVRILADLPGTTVSRNDGGMTKPSRTISQNGQWSMKNKYRGRTSQCNLRVQLKVATSNAWAVHHADV